ncbi:MAG: hypothetical protein M1133_16450 [Armatimonadetes bacterium]|nr:hypothetical protein [Armatimonadota bacterium]
MERQERGSDKLGYDEHDFKVCDLCGALNPVANDECFVCGWRGWFHYDAETIKDAIRSLKGEFGQLDASLFVEEVVPSTPPRPSLWAEVWGSLRKLFSRA